MHDYQIANIVEWLDPIGYNYFDTPYASTVFIELYFDTSCDGGSLRSDPYCWTVKVIYNGDPLKFDSCISSNKANGKTTESCTYQGFREHMNKISYGNIKAGCNQKFVKPQ